MAVLKSFELKGNKLSFANWISNLSPTTTPFTSMIGKEQIDETQYSWQIDGLARASTETFLEGSQADSQSRAATKVITNFTGNFRKAVNVSDTANAITSYGRNSELSYQMSKAGKEMLREIEVANLSKSIGHIGSDADPSKFTGFNFLCGPMYAVDPDTQAITHQGVSVIDPALPWFSIKDIFEITTNLYMSGSKADKIMFHPRHINIFSDLLGFNDEAPNVHRLFKGLDDKFNMNVSMIKDPLGRLYQLVPNRNMPETAVYFFNENDWTQMVLREPQRINLAKKGSYTSSMIETEIGLRHKHPHASGVLELQTVNFDAHLSVDQEKVSLLPGEFAGFLIHLLHKDGQPVTGMDFEIMLSDESIATLSSKAGQTGVQGSATFTLTGIKPGRVTVYVYGYNTAREFVSNAITVDFISPQLRIGVDDTEMALGERISAQTRVFDPVNGYLAADDTKIVWHSNSDQIVFVDNVSGDFIGPTATVPTRNGVSAVKVAAKSPGEYSIWSTYGDVVSNKIGVTVLTAGIKFLWNTKTLFTAGFASNEPMSVTVSDRHGAAVPDGTKVEWHVENGSRGSLSAQATTTTTGISVNNFTADTAGNTYIVLTVHGDIYKEQISCVNPSVDTVINPSNTFAIGGKGTVQTFVTDAEGSPLNNVRVSWSASPTSFAELGSVQGYTDLGGIATTEITGRALGKGELSTIINQVEYKKAPFYVGTGAEIQLSISPNPTKVGQDTNFDVTLVGADGVGLADVEITFASDPLIGDLDPLKGNTSPTGEYSTIFNTTISEDSRIFASATGYDCIAAVDLEFENAEYNYNSSDPTKITIGLGADHTFVTTVTDEIGAAVGNVTLEYSISDGSKASFKALNNSKTNGSGQSTLHITPLSKGPVDLSVKVKGKSNTRVFNLDIGDPVVTMEINPNPVNWGSNTNITGIVTGYGGESLDGVLVKFDTAPRLSTPIFATTGIDGTYTKSWAPESNSDFEFNAYLDKSVHVVSPIIQLVVNS